MLAEQIERLPQTYRNSFRRSRAEVSPGVTIYRLRLLEVRAERQVRFGNRRLRPDSSLSYRWGNVPDRIGSQDAMPMTSGP
jgi:hypothetical protein